jgi:hypothetical protein
VVPGYWRTCSGGGSDLDGGHGDGVERGHAARLAAEMKVGKYGDHFPDDTFVPLAVETYGCLDSAFDGFLGTCARRAAELRA